MLQVFGRICVLFLAFHSQAWAAGGLITMNNWYFVIAEKIFGSEEAAKYWWPVLAAVFVVVLIVLIGVFSGLSKIKPSELTDEQLLPPKKLSLLAFCELMFSIVSSTLESVLGRNWVNYATLLGGTFFFIVLSNLSGLFPGFAPATEQMNTTLGIALVIFVAFNFIGLKHAGMDYIKHLAGPILLLAPLIFVIEVISLAARPLSLSLRLFGNISGDHLVFNVFSTLMKNAGIPFLPVPAGILVFGTLVAVLQAFIFMTLSAVYVKLSLDTAHHGHDEEAPVSDAQARIESH